MPVIKRALVCLLILCCGTIVSADSTSHPTSHPVFKLNSLGPTQSFDPFEHDAFNSMVIFKNVNPRLISLGQKGPPKGILASHWDVSRDRLTWKFTIREGIKFSDGQNLNSEVVAKNLKRIVWLSRKDNLALNESFGNLDHWKSLDGPFKGITWNDTQVILSFEKEPSDLFEILEQVIFGVIPLTNFDQDTGKFKGGKPPSAGAYQIVKSDEKGLELKKNIFWAFGGPSDVQVSWDSYDLTHLGETPIPYDLMILNGSNMTKHFVDASKKKTLRIITTPPFLMNFVQLQPTKGAFKDLKLRKDFRDIFSQKFFESKESEDLFFASNSFIPKGGVGFLEFPKPLKKKNYAKYSGKIKIVWWPPTLLPKANDFLLAQVLETVQTLGLEASVVRCRNRAEMFDAVRRNDFDVIVRFTGLLVHNPFADLQMMFLSKLGALIPDVTGEIKTLLMQVKETEDQSLKLRLAKQINTQVYEDSSIITYSHSGFAFLFDPNKVDISKYNLSNDPFDLTSVELQ